MRALQLLILLATFINSCGAAFKEPERVESLFKDYVARFFDDAEAHNLKFDRTNIEVKLATIPNFAKAPLVVIGYCIELGKHFRPQVYISKEHWGNFSDAEKEGLIYHELGHCVLKRGHVTGELRLSQEAVPTSIMHPIAFDGEIYTKYRDLYLDELFLNVPATVIWDHYSPKP